jgi:hypothetical protein
MADEESKEPTSVWDADVRRLSDLDLNGALYYFRDVIPEHSGYVDALRREAKRRAQHPR